MICYCGHFLTQAGTICKCCGGEGECYTVAQPVEQQAQPPTPTTCIHGTTLGMCELCPSPASGIPPEQPSCAVCGKCGARNLNRGALFLHGLLHKTPLPTNPYDQTTLNSLPFILFNAVGEAMEAFASHQLQQAQQRIAGLEKKLWASLAECCNCDEPQRPWKQRAELAEAELAEWRAGNRSTIPTGIQRRDAKIVELKAERERLRGLGRELLTALKCWVLTHTISEGSDDALIARAEAALAGKGE